MMTVYCLEAHSTENFDDIDDIRYREYTRSQRRAELFKKIPMVQLTDSGHGIVFSAREHSGSKKPAIRTLWRHVSEELDRLKSEAASARAP